MTLLARALESRLGLPVLVFLSLAVSLAVAANAMAAPATPAEGARLAAQNAAWLGGKANADSLVNGLRNGSSVTLVTSGPGRTVSLAGFTPRGSMSAGEIAATLDNARRSLVRLRVRHPSADQVQAALIGGDITLPDGRRQPLRGTVALSDGSNRVAAR